MFILKLALATCAIYIGITLLILLAGIVVVHWGGIVGYTYSFRAWAVLFGLMWFASFTLAWRIVIQHTLKLFNS